MNVLLPIVRHWAGVAVAALVAWLATVGVDVSPEGSQEIVQATVIILGAALTAVYAAAEKVLKPVWRKVLGEQQPGDTPPPSGDQPAVPPRP